MVPRSHSHLRRRRRRVEAARRRTFYVLVFVAVLTVGWGLLIPLSYLLAPVRRLSAETSWVSTISYYANAVGGAATVAALSAKLTAHEAHDQSIENAQQLAEHGREPW